MAIWDEYVSAEDMQIFERSGYGTFLGLGERPALVVVDVTYAFTGDRNEPILDSIEKWPNSCGPAAWAAIPHIQELLTVFRARNLPIFYTKVPPARADGLGKGLWRTSRQAARAEPGVSGLDIVADIAPEERDVVITKAAPSAFFGTHLIAYLTSIRADTLVVCGGTTSGCVRATVIDAFSHNLHVAVAEDGTFDRGRASHAVTLFDLDAKYADVMTTAKITAQIGSLRYDLYSGMIAPAH